MTACDHQQTSVVEGSPGRQFQSGYLSDHQDVLQPFCGDQNGLFFEEKMGEFQ